MAAAETVKSHFQQILHPTIPDVCAEESQTLFQAFLQPAETESVTPFTWEEVSKAVDHLKNNKTTGRSGIPGELFKAMWQEPSGQQLVLAFCNRMLLEPKHPEDLHSAFVTLLPKVQHVGEPRQIRPINLVEQCHKMFSYLLVQRLQTRWTVPTTQHGAVKGGQTLDALASAHWNIAADSIKEKTGRIWLNTDIEAAFDSLQHQFLIQFLDKHTPKGCRREASMLLFLVFGPVLHFTFQGLSWSFDQTCGVQQGHCHSATLFSFVVGHLLQEVFQTWSSQGETSDIGSWGWLLSTILFSSFIRGVKLDVWCLFSSNSS